MTQQTFYKMRMGQHDQHTLTNSFAIKGVISTALCMGARIQIAIVMSKSNRLVEAGDRLSMSLAKQTWKKSLAVSKSPLA